jgi:hypothetical protein
MLHALARHLHHNFVGYLALFVAIGGTSYAAVSLLPAASERDSSGTEPSSLPRYARIR